jgi:hypothetical protein
VARNAQAAPLRRLHVTMDLRLHDGGSMASGGFMANLQVTASRPALLLGPRAGPCLSVQARVYTLFAVLQARVALRVQRAVWSNVKHAPQSEACGPRHAVKIVHALFPQVDRRVQFIHMLSHVHSGSCVLFRGCYTPTAQVDGKVFMGSQQQWMTRACSLQKHNDREGWLNFVFVGCSGAPDPVRDSGAWQ